MDVDAIRRDFPPVEKTVWLNNGVVSSTSIFRDGT